MAKRHSAEVIACARHVSMVMLFLLFLGEMPASAAYLVATLGDTAAQQLGASVRCRATFMVPAGACRDGTGFSELFARMLSQYEPTGFQVLASNVVTTSEVMLQEVPMMSPMTNIVVLYVGTNDSFQISAGYSTLQRWYADYDWLLRSIRRRAPEARMILVTIPMQKTTDGRFHAREAIVSAMNRHILSRDSHAVDVNCVLDPSTAFADQKMIYLSDAASAALARELLGVVRGRHRRGLCNSAR